MTTQEILNLKKLGQDRELRDACRSKLYQARCVIDKCCKENFKNFSLDIELELSVEIGTIKGSKKATHPRIFRVLFCIKSHHPILLIYPHPSLVP